MDTKLLLVKVITLLYRENQLKRAPSLDLVKETLSGVKLPDAVIETDRGRETMVALRATAHWMCEQPENLEYERSTFLQRIRVACGDDRSLYEALEQGIEDKESPDEVLAEIDQHRRDLYGFHRNSKVREILKKASTTVVFNEELVDWRTYVSEVMGQLEPYKFDLNAVLEVDSNELMFDDLEHMTTAMEEAMAANQLEGIMLVGYQGLQRLLGEHKGLRRGDLSVWSALQHNFKTGIMMSVFATIALFNKPYMFDETKKPMLMFISLENKIADNMMWLFKFLKENLEGKICNIRDYTPAEIAEYVTRIMREMGYYINLRYFNGSNFSFADLEERIRKFEADGFEIHLLCVDYLALMSKAGLETGGAAHAAGQDIRMLFRKTRALAADHNIHIMTPHQLSTEAKMLIREDMKVNTFVSDIAGKGYYDSCRTLDQEVDLEVHVHIVKSDGRKFLTVARGKHRGLIEQTIEQDLYCVLPFGAIGAIPWDYGKKDRTLRKVGGGSIGSGDENPWFDQTAMAA